MTRFVYLVDSRELFLVFPVLFFLFFLSAIYSSTCTALIRAQARARPWKMCSRCELECRKGLWRKRIGTPQGCTGETRVSENSQQDGGGFDRTKWRGASHWVQWDTITPRFRIEMTLYAVCMEFHRSPHLKKCHRFAIKYHVWIGVNILWWCQTYLLCIHLCCLAFLYILGEWCNRTIKTKSAQYLEGCLIVYSWTSEKCTSE